MECWVWVIFWVIVAVLLTIFILLAIAYGVVLDARNAIIREFTKSVNEYCANVSPIEYTGVLAPPAQLGEYEKTVAQNLINANVAVSQSSCSNIMLILPPPFTAFQRIVGIDPASGQPLMFAYIFWANESPSGPIGLISFTGTVTLSQWEDDFNFQLVPATNLYGVAPGSEIMVHGGFYAIYQAIRPQLWSWVDSHPNIRNLFVSGHSLGGALSTICAFDFAGSGRFNTTTNVSVLPTLIHQSFAAPRSGNIEYATTFNSLVPTSLRINNTEDVIPQLPPSAWQGNLYLQTNTNIPFTVNLGTLAANHTAAYVTNLPNTPEC